MVDINEEKNQVPEDKSYRNRRKHLIFCLGDDRYALHLSRIKEVIGLTPITPLPRMPSYYRGLINIRGQIISVIDLRIKMGMNSKKDDSKKTSIIISHVGDILVGIIVDEVLEVIGYLDSDIDQSEANRLDGKHDGVYGVAKDESGSLTLMIDLFNVFEKSEFRILKEKSA